MEFHNIIIFFAVFGASNAFVRNCREVQILEKHTFDGEYCMSLDGAFDFGQWVYCHGMNTYNPKEYLTLQAGPDENFSSTSNRAPCMVGTLKFEKVRLDLDAMVIKSWDDTFTIKEGIDVTRYGCDSQPLYGRAYGCWSPVGEVQVNLGGTGFYIPSTVQWYGYGWQPDMRLNIHTNQRIEGKCTGGCGGCEPRIDRNIGLVDIPIAFDNSYNTMKCQLGNIHSNQPRNV